MATNPYFTQYHTQRFSFIGSPQQRDGSYLKDQRFLNLYPELIKSPITDGKKYYLKKRPGLDLAYSLGAGVGRGLFYWPSNGNFYIVVGANVYQNGVLIHTLGTNVGPVGFCEFRTDTADLLVMCDGTSGYTIDGSGNVVLIVDVNFPSPHIPAPIFLDGYIFLAATGTQTIHNSTLGTPSTWPSDGFIDAEMYPDTLVTLTKAQNYLVAIGKQSIEFMYDNANATGSPLQRNAPAVAQFGCPAQLSVCQTEKEVILVGSTGAGGRTIWVVEGFQPTEIANEPVREALDAEGPAISNATAFVIQCSGHKWYVLNLSLRTFVYDFEEQMWHEWTSGVNQAAFSWIFATDSGQGNPMVLNATTGQTAFLDANTYTDLGLPINCVAITSKIDFDTIKRKRFFRLSLACDAPNGEANLPMLLYWTDDDYNTFLGPITLELNASYPTVTQLGYSRRRAFQFKYQQPYPLRMESFELDIVQEVRR